MSQYPAMPLFVREYRMDTLHLSTMQHGAYLLLLMQAWGSPQCRLQDCDEKLAAWANLSLADWGSLRHVLEPFFVIRGGWWTQKRLTKEWHFVHERQKSVRSRAKMGGAATALKNKAMRDALGAPKVRPKRALAAPPTPTPTPIFKKEYSPISSDSARSQEKWGSKQEYFERFWEAYGHKQQRKRAEEAFATAIGKASLDEILEGVKRYHQTRPSWQQIALAASWLKGERWNDNPVKAHGNGHDPPAPHSPMIFIKEGTPQWIAWTENYLQCKGKKPPKTTRQGTTDQGWYFPCEWPRGNEDEDLPTPPARASPASEAERQARAAHLRALSADIAITARMDTPRRIKS